jgi:hypothetical protein
MSKPKTFAVKGRRPRQIGDIDLARHGRYDLHRVPPGSTRPAGVIVVGGRCGLKRLAPALD